MPNCDSDLIPSTKAKDMSTNEVLANIFCVLVDISATLKEWLFLRRCTRIKEMVASETGELIIGVPFIPIGFKGQNIGGVFISFIDDETWTITFSNPTAEDEIFLYYEL